MSKTKQLITKDLITENIESENIHFLLFETEHESENINLSELFNKIREHNNEEYYLIKYTIKELLLISEYYGIHKQLKSNKSNKEEIIHKIYLFENDVINKDIVFKRRQFWYYITELKKDKFMKKYILWQ